MVERTVLLEQEIEEKQRMQEELQRFKDEIRGFFFSKKKDNQIQKGV